MKRRYLLALAVLALLVSAAPALAAVRGEPNLSVTLADDRIEPNGETHVEFTIQNRGELDFSSDPQLDDRVLTARGVSVEVVGAEGPVEARTDTLALGSIRDGSAVPATVRLFVPRDAAPGDYGVELRIEYRYIEQYDPDSGVIQERRRTFTVDRSVAVESAARFEVSDVETDAAVGDSGAVAFDVTNVGSETVSDARVTLSSENPQVAFDGASQVREQLGGLEPGETRRVTVDADVASGAERRNYSMTAVVDYEDEDGASESSEELSFGLYPEAEQTFGVENVRSTLRVGEDGEIVGVFVNEGDAAAENVVLRVASGTPNVEVREPEVALGTVEPGERVEFTFDADVSSNAREGDRQLTLVASYRNRADERRESDDLDAQVAVGPKRDEFGVSGVNATLEQGESGRLELRVRNNLDGTVTDVSAKLFTDPPLGSGDDEAFVAELEPGESTVLVFGLNVGDGALVKTYPAEVDFRYETADGETRISDTYNVPIDVREREGNGGTLPLLGGAAIVLLLAVGGVLYVRRT